MLHVSLSHDLAETVFAGTIVISKFVIRDRPCSFHDINQYIRHWGYSRETFCTATASHVIQKCQQTIKMYDTKPNHLFLPFRDHGYPSTPGKRGNRQRLERVCCSKSYEFYKFSKLHGRGNTLPGIALQGLRRG